MKFKIKFFSRMLHNNFIALFDKEYLGFNLVNSLKKSCFKLSFSMKYEGNKEQISEFC